jgi:regulator of protease activity HflC (stomatin/prohibitin superfamily)
LARGVQRLKRQTQKVFADKQGLPGNWAPLVQEVRGLSSGFLVCRDPEAIGEACGQGVARVGVLSVDGKVRELLAAGAYGFWRYNRQVQVECVDLRSQSLEVTGQEILTKDKVSLRLNLSATWRYEDVLKAYAQWSKPAEQVYRELQLGLRAAVGTRTLDELLENKSTIDDIVTEYACAKLVAAGLKLESLGVKDIIFPGDMKTILAQVVEAEKSAQANVTRRREETAATRSLLNTAKLMEDNPIALRMKELETLEGVAERIDKISVFGGLDQVLNGLVKLR